jgi:hypothetical protein
MARRRTIDRKALRDANDAAERREGDDSVEEEVEEEASADDGDGGDDDGGAKAKTKAKPKKKAAAKAPAKPRTRTPKVVRMRAFWAVFDHSGKVAEKFPYNARHLAEEYIVEKNSGEKKHTFYIQVHKEPIE